LASNETGTVLPGAVVAIIPETSDAGRETAVVRSQVAAAALDGVELLIVTENALVGGGINRPSKAGEVINVHRAVSGYRFLVRVVAGVYQQGDQLYLTQTANGIYFTKTLGGAPTVRAVAVENFTVTAGIVNLVDNSNSWGTGDNAVPNGGLVNLLRVRIA
jgi:hypothetical protein